MESCCEVRRQARTDRWEVARFCDGDGSDFVFEKDYKLRSIGDLETFIKENKHLPDIPSANDVKENGIDLGEMDAKLLQKIEELTLYIIEQQKQLEELRTQIEKLNK